MKDIFEAIERLSAKLSFLTEQTTMQRSLAVQFSGYAVSPQKNVLIRLYHVMVHLPRGYACNFRPRSEVNPDGQSWHIDITRSDGTVRKSWQRGIEVARLGDGKFYLLYDGRELRDEDLMAIITDMERPGLSGMGIDIRRVYSLRFGHLPRELEARIETITEVDRLDQIYDTLTRGGTPEEVEQLLSPPPAASVEAAPVETPPVEIPPVAAAAAPAASATPDGPPPPAAAAETPVAAESPAAPEIAPTTSEPAADADASESPEPVAAASTPTSEGTRSGRRRRASSS